jgi:sec-independent protein translocase protein TatA
MGSLSPWHLLILGLLVLLIFGGRGKLSGIMGDAAKGIKAFKDGLKDEEQKPPAAAPPLPREAEKEEAKNPG